MTAVDASREVAGQWSRGKVEICKVEIYSQVARPGQGAPLEASTESSAHQIFQNYWGTSFKH